MAFLKAKKYLLNYGLEDRIIEFPFSTATVSLAADALHVSEGEIAKSMAFFIKEKAILVIMAGDKKIDNHKFKEEFEVKAKMISSDAVESVIGHAAGGVCPFGINKEVEIYLDVSLKLYKVVYPACGSHNSAVKLKLEELENCVKYIKWVDVSKE